MDYDVASPDPAGTIESLCSLGYSLETAIADIVDNSIDASASAIDLIFHWAGSNSYIAVVDDGVGMTEQQLREAMTIAARGPRTARTAAELGRFGMGLKTASFSQASRLSVWTRTEISGPNIRQWDLDHVVSTGEWRLLRSVGADTMATFQRVARTRDNARTIVLWENLRNGHESGPDGQANFLESVAAVERHLSATFARFIRGGPGGRKLRIDLTVNGANVTAWDPMMECNPGTLALPVNHLDQNGSSVTVSPYILPPRRRLSDEDYEAGAGGSGWTERQGFYLYRNDRLIIAGGWLGLARLRADERTLLARIAIDIPSSLDHAWSIDVMKASAQPPARMRTSLTRIAKAVRAQASRIQASIVRTVSTQASDPLTYVWLPQRQHNVVRLKLNWAHPLIREILEQSTEHRQKLHALLSYIEETVPIGAIRLMHDPDNDREHQPFSDAAPDEILEIAEQLYIAYVNRGLSPAQSRSRLQHTPPFDEYPDLVRRLDTMSAEEHQ